ncbi:MAG TPA: MltA domain-containing protein [Burkholderiales bacterium]|nr:MltA domain-containing protein [Burkholderiales bacterium]
MRRLAPALILVIAACALPPPAARGPYAPASFDALPGWAQAKLEPSLRAFLAGCPRASGVLIDACALASSVAPGDEAAARRFFESAFTPYALLNPDGSDAGLVTGYYEPLLRGSRTKSDLYRYPVYGVPDDLVVVDLAAVTPEVRNLRLRGRLDGRRVVPYWSRAEIDARGDKLPAPVIAWIGDPVDLFFLQVQGSGQILLEGGERIRVGYADQNGHPYRSVGRYLVERGELPPEQASMQAIKEWAAANPDKLREALNYNSSYVFFREVAPLADRARGPFGSLGVPLVPQYSLAVDRRFVPLGAPLYLQTTLPESEAPLERLGAAHDTGGAIRGAVRADLFWGTGDEAGAAAGRMRQQGRLWLLCPRGEPLPAAN